MSVLRSTFLCYSAAYQPFAAATRNCIRIEIPLIPGIAEAIAFVWSHPRKGPEPTMWKTLIALLATRALLRTAPRPRLGTAVFGLFDVADVAAHVGHPQSAAEPLDLVERRVCGGGGHWWCPRVNANWSSSALISSRVISP